MARCTRQGSVKGVAAALASLAVAHLPARAVDLPPSDPQNYIFAGGDSAQDIEPLLDRPDIAGVQIIYSWKQLEPEQGKYDFSAIERDLATTEAIHKKLWVQLQDRFFLPTARNLPGYILTEPKYHGGLQREVTFVGVGKPQGEGWAAKQWVPAVRKRYQALIAALAKRFDGRIAGINFDETAIDVGEDTSKFACDGYFAGELENARFARKAFTRSMVVQYINFWPCQWGDTRGYFKRFFAAAQQDGIGLGGPDIVPWKKGQMKNSYPFFHTYRGKLPIVAMAVQEPTMSYTNPKTGKKFTRQEFLDFAKNYLGANIIFWSEEAPWLRSGAPAQ